MSLRTEPITGILLAAGSGSRFGPDGSRDKLLAPMPDGTPLAIACLRLLLPACNRVVAVVRPDAQALGDALTEAGSEVLVCPSAALGMGASLACAAAAILARPSSCMVALADMPWIRPQTFAQVAALLALHPIVAPAFEGQRGHPVGFSSALLPALAQLTGDTGARHLLQARPIYQMDCDDVGIVRDVDYSTDLQAPPPGHDPRAQRFYKIS